MSDTIEKLRNLAKSNFCEECYSKYLALFQPTLKHLLSEPIVDWKQAEINIDVLWIKAMNLYNVENTNGLFMDDSALQKAKVTKLYEKLQFLREKGILRNSTYKFISKVSERRNKIHPQYFKPNSFSKEDYLMFREVKNLTTILFLHAVRNVKDEFWKNDMVAVEERAKMLLEKFNL